MNHTILTITKIEGKSFSFVYGDIDIPEEWYGQFIKVYSIKYNVKNKYIRFHINNKLDDNVICIDVHPIVYKDLDIFNKYVEADKETPNALSIFMNDVQVLSFE